MHACTVKSYFSNIETPYADGGMISRQWGYAIIQDSRRVQRYQRGNQNPYIEEEQTTKWPKEIV